MTQNSILHLENVTKSRVQGMGYALHIPSLTIYEGERIAILGASGSGKSTVMDILAFLLEPDENDVFTFTPTVDVSETVTPTADKSVPVMAVMDIPVTGMPTVDMPSLNMPKVDRSTINSTEEISYNIKALWQAHAYDALAAIRLQHLGVILQSGALLPFLSVYDNMALGMQAKHSQNVQNGHNSHSEENAHMAHEYIEDLARQLGIEHLLHSMPHTLSLGERQRVAIGRTLAVKPSIILADEPTAALDPIYAQTVMDLLTQALYATKTTLIFVTHDLHLAQSNATRLLNVNLEQQGIGATNQTVIATLYENTYV